jgi:uncharacterized membrane protein
MRDRFLWIGCVVYAGLLTWLGAIKYAAHRNLVDFGIFSQTVASAFGCFCNPIEGSHWAFHFSPILFVAGAAVALAHSPLTLVALQAIAGALVAPPIYALVRPRGGAGAARLTALVVWLYPALAGLAFGDFHENGFAPAAVAWTLYAFDAGLVVWTLVAAAFVLAIKEDQALFLAVAGALGGWRYRGTPRGRLATIVGIAGVVVVVAFFAWIRPHAAAAAGWQPWRFYSWPPGAYAVPYELGSRLGFLLLVFVPLLFLPLRSAMMWLAVAPLGEVLLSRMPTTFTLGTHYAGAWLGYVLVAFACAVRDLPVARMRSALAACAALCIVELAVADPLHPGLNLRRTQARDAALDRFLQTLPPDAAVATQEEAYTHLALLDRNATLLPEMPSEPLESRFVLVDGDFPDSPRLQEYGAALARAVAEGRYVLVRREGNIALYERSATAASAARAGQPASARTMRCGAAHGDHRATCNA